MRRSAGAWSGKTSEVPCVPEYRLKTGCSFPMTIEPETTSQNSSPEWDALSG